MIGDYSLVLIEAVTSDPLAQKAKRGKSDAQEQDRGIDEVSRRGKSCCHQVRGGKREYQRSELNAEPSRRRQEEQHVWRPIQASRTIEQSGQATDSDRR